MKDVCLKQNAERENRVVQASVWEVYSTYATPLNDNVGCVYMLEQKGTQETSCPMFPQGLVNYFSGPGFKATHKISHPVCGGAENLWLPLTGSVINPSYFSSRKAWNH